MSKLRIELRSQEPQSCVLPLNYLDLYYFIKNLKYILFLKVLSWKKLIILIFYTLVLNLIEIEQFLFKLPILKMFNFKF
jgi:hypothetical protein